MTRTSMANGHMLGALKAYTDKGEEIPDQLYKALTLASHVDLSQSMVQLADQIGQLERSGSILAKDNKCEIDLLRKNNKAGNVVSGFGIVVAGILAALGLTN